MVPVAAALLLVLMGASAGTPATAGYGSVQYGRATFYGGAPDGMNPYNPSYGTKEGSCGCDSLHSALQKLPSLAVL